MQRTWRYIRVLVLIAMILSASVAGLHPNRAAASGTVITGDGPNSPIPARYIYAVTPDGQLLISVDNSSDTVANWMQLAVPAPTLADVNWAAFDEVFPGGDGVIYAIDTQGSLRYFRLLDPWRNGGQMRWSTDSNTVLTTEAGTGNRWLGLNRMSDMATSVLRGGTLWLGVNHESTSGLFFMHGWKSGGLVDPQFSHGGTGVGLSFRGPTVPARCLACFKIFEGGDGISYAVETSGPDAGGLRRYRVDPRWQEAGPDLVIDQSQPWGSYKFVFAEPGAYLIEGYVSTQRADPNTGTTVASMSVAAGDTVKIRASTFAPQYTARLLPLQRHTQEDATTPSGLIDGVVVSSPVTVQAPAGGNFKKTQNSSMYSTGANWIGDGADITLPLNAAPGLYAAELTTPSGGRALAPFVVKPAPSQAARGIAVIANTSTWNAYNQWSGTSRYFTVEFPERIDLAGQPSFDLSYERPMLETPYDDNVVAAPGLVQRDPQPLNHLTRAEVWATTWLDGLAAADTRYRYDMYSDV